MRRSIPVTRPRTIALVIALLAVCAIAALGTHLTAMRDLARSRDSSLALAARAQQAERAARLEPFRTDLHSWSAELHGELLLRNGKLEEARSLLIAAYARDRSNTELRAVLRKVNLARIVRDSRKAHQQHGHEGPGGTLRPQDLVQ
jgi:hypothetical protein